MLSHNINACSDSDILALVTSVQKIDFPFPSG